ncbi:MAG: hypothetical protein MJ091_00450 [Clostridia bacterium]|nr:hypothetical protein [Clostridia bacterium]
MAITSSEYLTLNAILAPLTEILIIIATSERVENAIILTARLCPLIHFNTGSAFSFT